LGERDVTQRFSERVAHYVQSRPGYPDVMMDCFLNAASLGAGCSIADIGCGTGLLARPFLERGCHVVGVEPNEEMRAAGDALLGKYSGFESCAGRAEATGLPDASVDAIMVGQAFHWFDVAPFRREMIRILRPPFPAMLCWNSRSLDGTPFLRAYEAFLQEWGTDYAEVSDRYEAPESLTLFFGGHYESAAFDNRQDFDHEGLRERLLSSSYVPGTDDPRHAPMLEALGRLFDTHEQGGRVAFLYETRMYYGNVTP
jgi:SAM-dependent methyltransferase